jgi:hypothetical protein
MQSGFQATKRLHHSIAAINTLPRPVSRALETQKILEINPFRQEKSSVMHTREQIPHRDRSLARIIAKIDDIEAATCCFY